MAADSGHAIREEARKLLAWQAIADEAGDLKLDESQKRQLMRISRRHSAT